MFLYANSDHHITPHTYLIARYNSMKRIDK